MLYDELVTSTVAFPKAVLRYTKGHQVALFVIDIQANDIIKQRNQIFQSEIPIKGIS